MFREIRRVERLTEEDIKRRREEEERNRRYLQIKPETDMTLEEAKDFVMGLFM